jgi:type IV pilus assembly protein PilC
VAGGILDVILRRLSIFVEKAAKLKKAVVSAAVYPSVIICVAVAVVFVIMLYVVPVFATVFTGMNMNLPLPTRITMATSSIVGQFSIPIVLLVIIGVFGLRYYYKTEPGRWNIDRFLLALPGWQAEEDRHRPARAPRHPAGRAARDLKL